MHKTPPLISDLRPSRASYPISAAKAVADVCRHNSDINQAIGNKVAEAVQFRGKFSPFDTGPGSVEIVSCVQNEHGYPRLFREHA